MVRKYVPARRTRECEHGCGTYTVNGTGRLRKHSVERCTKGCEGGCDGVTPLGAQMKALERAVADTVPTRRELTQKILSYRGADNGHGLKYIETVLAALYREAGRE